MRLFPGLRPRGFRAGIVIGLAVALVGLLVGTATGAATPFQQVIVVNSPASPIPVSLQGTGSISGTVAVSNFPATQPISGTVNVGRLPAATKAFGTGQLHLDAGGGNATREFGQTINVTAVSITNLSADGTELFSDTILTSLVLALGGPPFLPVHGGDGSAFVVLPQPVPATGIAFLCENSSAHCDFFATVIGN